MRDATWLAIGAAFAFGASPVSARSLAAPASADLTRFFTSDDYPPEVLRLSQQGRVVAKLWIDATGRVISCTVTTSSGSPSLDQRTCEIALTKLAYDPARNARGSPIAVSVTLPVMWRLPAPGAGRYAPVVPLAAVVEQVVGDDGQRRSCVFRLNGVERPDAAEACNGGLREIQEVLAKVPETFRGHALVVYSETLQDYAGSPPAARLDEADLTIVGRISVRFTISTNGRVSDCRGDGSRESQGWLRTIPCNGELTFRGADGGALSQPVEATWTVIQAVRLLPHPGGV